MECFHYIYITFKEDKNYETQSLYRHNDNNLITFILRQLLSVYQLQLLQPFEEHCKIEVINLTTFAQL